MEETNEYNEYEELILNQDQVKKDINTYNKKLDVYDRIKNNDISLVDEYDEEDPKISNLIENNYMAYYSTLSNDTENKKAAGLLFHAWFDKFKLDKSNMQRLINIFNYMNKEEA